MGTAKARKRDDDGFAEYRQRLVAAGYAFDPTRENPPTAAAEENKPIPPAGEQIASFIQTVESYLMWDRLKNRPHPIDDPETLIVGDFGDWKMEAARLIISQSKPLAMALHNLGGDPATVTAVLEIANRVRDPDDGPSAIRASWPKVKATLERMAISSGMDDERRGSNVTSQNIGQPKTTNDTENDTEKKSGKIYRPLNVEAHDLYSRVQKTTQRRRDNHDEIGSRGICAQK